MSDYPLHWQTTISIISNDLEGWVRGGGYSRLGVGSLQVSRTNLVNSRIFRLNEAENLNLFLEMEFEPVEVHGNIPRSLLHQRAR